MSKKATKKLFILVAGLSQSREPKRQFSGSCAMTVISASCGLYCFTLYIHVTDLTVCQHFIQTFGIVCIVLVIGHCSLTGLFVCAPPPNNWICLTPNYGCLSEISNIHPSCWFHPTMDYNIPSTRWEIQTKPDPVSGCPSSSALVSLVPDN